MSFHRDRTRYRNHPYQRPATYVDDPQDIWARGLNPLKGDHAGFAAVIERANSERIFVLQEKRVIDKDTLVETERTYDVTGSTGNVYCVTIGCVINCTCPHHLQGWQCKHIVRILTKVYRLPHYNQYIRRRKLTPDELATLTLQAKGIPKSIKVEEQVLAVYEACQELKAKSAAASTQEALESQTEGDAKAQEVTLSGRPRCLIGLESEGKDETCFVCFGDLVDSEERVVFCKAQCGKNIHEVCIKRCLESAKERGQEESCPLCRVRWIDDKMLLAQAKQKKEDIKNATNAQSANKYLNLSAALASFEK